MASNWRRGLRCVSACLQFLAVAAGLVATAILMGGCESDNADPNSLENQFNRSVDVVNQLDRSIEATWIKLKETDTYPFSREETRTKQVAPSGSVSIQVTDVNNDGAVSVTVTADGASKEYRLAYPNAVRVVNAGNFP